MPRSPIIACLLALVILLSGCAREATQTRLMTSTTQTSPSAIEWCGSLALPGQWQDDTPVGGLSALGWDRDESLLYLISDRGWLHRARLRFEDSVEAGFEDGKLSGLEPLKTYVLRDDDGNALDEDAADAESLVLRHADNGLRGDTTLLIGFERDHRLQRFYPNGLPIDEPLTPKGLRRAKPNTGAEAMGRHVDKGIIVGLESTPAGAIAGTTRLFSLKTGDEWHYPLAGAAGSALTALETYGDDLLALERAFAPPAPLVISLRRVSLGDDAEIEVETLARLSSGDGWRLDNFEGLTRLGGNRYLMVSDDNFSLIQQTLLSCFELPPPRDA
ncbi:hypothetical protein SAMN05661010_02711 [Modicisalibacter muralis]|uniref:Phytase-like domain-containing protein n=1 Tax=Modicisalibacter muralis TaxID=119000 RepID=A0A1G9NH19_9GAMM|nr:esterase-like activity of phytase family protein [Halomonas muralis]SDL85822.1 hypothetical protein SAMN05661010_02711 [Halomonas muralis]